MDPVLTGATPRLTTADAVEIGASLFGVRVATARDLGSERDRTFLLGDVAILKVSNSAEDTGRAGHGGRGRAARDRGRPVAASWRCRCARVGDSGVAGCALAGGEHWVRLYDVLPGNSRIVATELSDAALRGLG